eukprot:gene37520-50652_t
MSKTAVTAEHSISEAEITLFENKPDFKIGTCLTRDHYHSDWSACMNDFALFGLTLSDLHARDTIYQQCRKRYLLLHSKRAELAKIPELANSLFLVLAEALFWLSDYSGSLNFLRQLDQGLLALDLKLKRLIQLVQAVSEKSIREQIAEESRKVDDDGLPVFHIQDPMSCSSLSVQQEDIDGVRKEWERCKADVGEQLAVEIFSRYACVTTNELENVFEVDGFTLHRLVRKGFLEKSIVGITENSKIKSKSRILKILRNTSRCMDEVGNIRSHFESYDENFVCMLHANLMNGENIEIQYGDDGVELCSLIIPLGEYRMMGCHTYHFPYGKEDNDNDKNEEGEGEREEEGICMQYCSFVKIPMLMKSYCEEARKVLQDPSLDVFMK